MKKLLIYMKEYRGRALLAPLFKLTEAIFELFVPLVVADIIDNGIKNGDSRYVLSCGLLMVALGIIGFVCALVAQYFAARSAVGFAANIRTALFKKIQSFSYTELDNIGTSTLITRLTGDVNQIQTGVNIALRLLLRSPFIVFGAMIMAFTVDVKSALIFVASIPLLAIVVVAVMAVTVPLYKKVQKRLDKVLLKTRENIHGVRVIRSFCKEDDETKSFAFENGMLLKLQKTVGRIAALMNPLTYVIVNSAIIAIIWFGGKQVYKGNLSQGEVIALYNYMTQILVELIKLANMIITINKSLASASRIEAVLNTDNIVDKASENTHSDAFIEFKNVSFKYSKSNEYSLENINFSVNKGETIGIIGPTGSGKSTLINLIPHFYGSTHGDVLLEGKDVKCLSDEYLRSRIGIVPQKSVLFKGTVRDNLLLGGKTANDDQLNDALKTAQALDVVELKGGLSAEVLSNGKNLSGGQRQRLCIARALVSNPEILIFDDSASALDYATEAKLRKELNSLPFNPTVFIVSQRVSSVMYADKIIVLEDGMVVGMGKHDELLKNCSVYAEICHTQLKEED